MGTHNKETRIKDFEGLPHELKGLDYTDNAEVEGGEKGYTPLGSDNEFIFRKTSKNISELQKEDKLRENRPKGDRISDISFDAAAANIIMKEIKDLVSEGIDPFNVEGNQEQNTFKVGGVKYATGGKRYTVPTVDDSAAPVIPENSGYNIDSSSIQLDNRGMSAGQAGGYAAAAGGLASSLGQLGAEDPYAGSIGKKDVGTQAVEGTIDSVASAIPVVGQFYGAGKGLSSGAEAVRDQARSQGEDEAAQAWAYMGGTIDPMGSWFDLKADKDAGVKGTTGAAIANVFLPGLGDAIMEPNRRKFAESQQQKIENADILAQRDRFEGEADVPRTRYNDQTIMRNGGVKKKYAGDEGSVRNILGQNDLWNPSEQDMLAGNMSYIPFANRPNDLQVTSNVDMSYLKPDYIKPTNEYINEPIDAEFDKDYSKKDAEVEKFLANHYNMDYSNLPEDTTKDNTKKKMTPDQIKQLYQGILGFGANAAGSIAYLAGEGKDYDRVKYPTYTPERMTADAQLREARDQSASTIEALRKQGKLDPNALAQLATSGSKSTAGVRENVANYNIGNRNQAQQFNIGTDIRGQQDEAANKGVALSEYYDAIDEVAKAAGQGVRQSDALNTEETVKLMYENVFGKIK